MDVTNFFSIASQQNRWLSVRQSVLAQNVANVNTPGFKALDVEPFEAVLNSTGIEMRQTQPTHIAPTPAAAPTVSGSTFAAGSSHPVAIGSIAARPLMRHSADSDVTTSK